jgi:hypothetical protein
MPVICPSAGPDGAFRNDEGNAHQPFRFRRWNQGRGYALFSGEAADFHLPDAGWESAMSIGTILIIIVIIYLVGGFSGRFGGYGYGMGHSGMGLGGVILIVLIILLLLGKL